MDAEGFECTLTCGPKFRRNRFDEVMQQVAGTEELGQPQSSENG